MSINDVELNICPHLMLHLRGHLGVPDTVSEPRIVPLNLVILHLINLKAYKHTTSHIVCIYMHKDSASGTPTHPLKCPDRLSNSSRESAWKLRLIAAIFLGKWVI